MAKSSKVKINQIAQLIEKYYNSKNIAAIQRLVKRNQINKINEAIQTIKNMEVVIFVLVTTSELKNNNNIFRVLPDYLQRQIISSSTNNQLKIILKNCFPDELLDIINANNDLIKKILLCLTSKQRQMIKQISSFENDEAGSIMNPDFISFKENWTIKECINLFHSKYQKIENNNTFFVTSNNNVLVGEINIQNLIFIDDFNKTVGSVMNQSILYVNPNEDIERIINLFHEYNIDSLAVVNKHNELIGIITDNDIFPSIESEITEDIYHMYGISDLHESYMKSSVISIVKSRWLWLVILMVSSTLTSIVISLFENWGKMVTAGISAILLVPIVPVITGTSGNAGSQSVASVVRALTIGEVTPKEYKRVILKEIKVGVFLGVILALFNFVRLAIYFAIPAFRQIDNDVLIKINEYLVGLIVAASSSIALWISIILSKVLGATLPLLATKLKLDPTVMSSPLISTTLDVCSTSILFAIGIGCLTLVIN